MGIKMKDFNISGDTIVWGIVFTVVIFTASSWIRFPILETKAYNDGYARGVIDGTTKEKLEWLEQKEIEKLEG